MRMETARHFIFSRTDTVQVDGESWEVRSLLWSWPDAQRRPHVLAESPLKQLLVSATRTDGWSVEFEIADWEPSTVDELAAKLREVLARRQAS